jgi:hypothetical protein
MRVLALVIVILVWGGAAVAQDNRACGKLQNPLAYNACLASQGPPARIVRAAPSRVTVPPRHRGGWAPARGRRVHAVFNVR